MRRMAIPSRTALAAVLWLAAGLIACDTTTGVRTQFFGQHAFTGVERRTISRVASAAASEARRFLPSLPSQISLRVESGTRVIPEIGATAAAIPPDWIRWTVDPANPLGVTGVAETHLRAALFHEFHHLVRGAANPPLSLMDHVVMEGLATAFERDFAAASPPWGTYSPEVASRWLQELLELPATVPLEHWITQHPDGRRWMGMRAGTYAVDLAMKKLGRTSAELATTPTSEILAAALAGDSR
jgi:hypothetical protein